MVADLVLVIILYTVPRFDSINRVVHEPLISFWNGYHYPILLHIEHRLVECLPSHGVTYNFSCEVTYYLTCVVYSFVIGCFFSSVFLFILKYMKKE